MQSVFLPEELVSDRLRLRRPASTDLPALYDIYSDKSVAQWLNWPVYTDRDAFAKDIERYEALWKRGEEYYWVIELSASSSVIGSIACGIKETDADIGFMLSTNYRGQGYATEAARRLLNELISSDKIQRVVALTAVENDASIAVLGRAGMQKKGVAPEFLVCPNMSDKARDALIFSIDCRDIDTKTPDTKNSDGLIY